ncbi:MAG: 4Fe-4S binding protein [Armatimonadota bacterium]
MKRRITLVRRLVQVVCFALLVYGGWLWSRPVGTPLPTIEAGTPNTALYPRDRILWVSGEESVLDVYLPILACRFIARRPLFKSCSLHVLSENITWKTSLKLLIPHIAFLTVLSFAFARGWCGWVCPIGGLIDFMNGLRKLLRIPPMRVGADWNRFLSKLRHFLLWFALAVSALIAIPALGRSGINDSLFLIYCQMCPARLVYPPLGGENPCWFDTSSGLTVFMTLVGCFVLSFVSPRLWCRVCAIGALISYFNRGGLTALQKRPRKCTFCGTCERVCPMDIKRVHTERKRTLVTDSQCLLCFRCVQECPESACLTGKCAGIKIVES